VKAASTVWNGGKSRDYIRGLPIIIENHVARIAPAHIWFRKGICWNHITARERFATRFLAEDSLFETAAPAIFFEDDDMNTYALGFLNSFVAEQFIMILNPTLCTNVRDVMEQPLIVDATHKNKVISLTSNCIEISRTDWDNFEISKDFKTHPLVMYRHSVAAAKIGTIADSESGKLWENMSYYLKNAYQAWEYNAQLYWETLKRNEEELNRIFIDIYGLQDELTPEVEDKDVTVRRADLGRDIRSFISYAAGCMFGRYTPYEDGLWYAGGHWDSGVMVEKLMRQQQAKNEPHLPMQLFLSSEDNIIPIGTNDYFENDIVLRFVDFIRKVYGEDTLGENLDFIANALYPNASGTANERIRRYFVVDFYKDHLKVYQKRPIYWLLDSGKKDGFKVLFYLHRYDKYTMARARTDYLHPLQRKYDAEIKRLELLASETEDSKEKAASRKEVGILQNQIDECRIYDQVLAHIAHQQIVFDLDDGVKVNYAKFQGVEVPKDDGKIEKMDLLGKI